MKNDHLTTIDHKKFFQTNKLFDKTNFLMKETFKWKKLFNEYAFWKNKHMYQQNHFFDDEKNFLTKQTLNMLLSQNVENWRILDIIDNFWKIIDKFWILLDNFPKIIDNFQNLLIISKIYRQFQSNDLFLTKQTFSQNKFWKETNFITYLLLWLLKAEIFDWLIFRIIQKFSISFSAGYRKAWYNCSFNRKF